MTSLRSLLIGDLWAEPAPNGDKLGPLDTVRKDLMDEYTGGVCGRLSSLQDSAARNLLLGCAHFADGRNDEARRVLAPLLLNPDNGLTAAGREVVLKILQEIAPELEDHGPAGIAARFYFGPGPAAGTTPFHRVLSRQKGLAKTPASTIHGGEYYIEFLKRYSSYTPLIEIGDQSLGGGYFLVADGQGCVIDPGYDFLENFKRRHTIEDIHAVVVTHNHDDHNADLPALMSLLFHQKSKRGRVNFYLDCATMADHRHQIDDEMLHSLSAPLRGWKSDAPFVSVFPGLQLRPIPAVHKLTPQDAGESAVGLHFRAAAVGGARDLIIGGDTAWSPELRAVYESLKAPKPILVAHISTASEKEAPGALGLQPAGYYPNHLAIRGVLEMIEACEPSCVVLSEIGEELKDVVDWLAAKIKSVFGFPCFVGMLNRPEEIALPTRLRKERLDLFAV